MLQSVGKILSDWKVEFFFLESGYSLKAWHSEERVSVATMLEQYTCREVVASSGAYAIHHTVKMAALPRPQGGQIMK